LKEQIAHLRAVVADLDQRLATLEDEGKLMTWGEFATGLDSVTVGGCGCCGGG